MTVRTRLERLESAAAIGDATLEEVVCWSYRTDFEGAEYADFAKRLANSRLGQLMQEIITRTASRPAAVH